MFDICNMQDCTIMQTKDIDPGDFFQRRLNSTLLSQWREVCALIDKFDISAGHDKFFWGLNKKLNSLRN